MAKKKTTKTSKRRRSSKRSSKTSMGSFVDVQKLMGLAAGAFANSMVKKIPGTAALNPKILAAAKIVGGQMLPNMAMAKNAIGNDSLRNGFGDALIYEGVKELMAGFGISGLTPTKPKGSEFLAISIEGLDDPTNVNEDIKISDEYEIGESFLSGEDLSIVNDDMNEDMNEDLSVVNEDLSIVNDDLL